MKKLFALLVVAGMVFVSCGNTATEPTVEAEAETIEADAPEANEVEAAEMDAAEEAPAEAAE